MGGRFRLGTLLLVIVAAVDLSPALGQDFRIDTEVFVDGRKEPIAESLTLFVEGRIFDFGGAESEIALIDRSHGQMTLLDPVRKKQTSLAAPDALQLMLQIEAFAAASPDPVFSFAARPKFTTSSSDEKQGDEPRLRLQLKSDVISYNTLAFKPPRGEAAHLYRYFADWSARLNALRPGNLPPGARLELNAALAERGLIPLRVERTIQAGRLGRKIEVRSEHLITWSLSGEDRRRLERATDYLSQFPHQPFDEYRLEAAKPQPARQAQK